MIKKNKQYKNGQGGYTLLFAVLTATLVLGVAVFIVGLSRKQHELAISARNSIYSFYAADSGIECAVSSSNWAGGSFASTTGGTMVCGMGQVVLQPVPTPQISGMSIKNDPNNPGGNPVRQFSGFVSLAFNNGTSLANSCAQITITTGVDTTSNQKKTIIDSRGYNLCTSDSPPAPDTVNTSTVERALRLVQGGVW